MVRKEKENPNHHMGKQTGYSLINGEYHIAPTYQERFLELANKQESVSGLMKVVTVHCTTILEGLADVRRKIWRDIVDDLGLDKNKLWVYSEGVIREDSNKKANQ